MAQHLNPSCVILERSEESRLIDARRRASILTSPVISRERRAESQSDSVGEGSAARTDFLLFPFPHGKGLGVRLPAPSLDSRSLTGLI
jgi:hypothetical protein